VSSFVHRRSVLRLATGSAVVAVTGSGAAILAAGQALAEQDPAAQLVQRAADQGIEVARANAGPAREAGIRRVLESYFDLAYMGRSTLGIEVTVMPAPRSRPPFAPSGRGSQQLAGGNSCARADRLPTAAMGAHPERSRPRRIPALIRVARSIQA
jgi:hypothetical protein